AVSSATNYNHASWQNPRHAAQQYPAAAIVFGQKIGAHHHRHATSDLTHRFQQRQTVVDLNRLVGHRCDARFEQRLSERLTRGKMQVREKDLPLTQQRKLRFQRFLDFHNHVVAREYLFRLIDNFRPGVGVLFVRIARAYAGILFHQHRMTAASELLRGRWQQPDALLPFLNFFGDAYDHLRRVRRDSWEVISD